MRIDTGPMDHLENSARGWLAAVVLALLFIANASGQAQPPDIQTEAKADRVGIGLAESVRITLTIEGPAPLRVEVPESLLAAEANAVWRIRPDPTTPLARVTAAGPGRERWQQVLRLDPFAEGKPLVASFKPIKVNGLPAVWEAVKITVTKSVGDPSTTPPRPPVGPEDPPLPPPSESMAPVTPWAAAILGLGCVAVLVALRLRRQGAKPIPPHAWARAQFAELGTTGAATVDRVAAVIRVFVERRFAIPAPKLTTGELAGAAREQDWPLEQVEELRSLLEECDRVKFAREVPDDDRCRRLVQRAVEWIDLIARPTDTRMTG